jgi:SAM-dependent methyltransferase
MQRRQFIAGLGALGVYGLTGAQESAAPLRGPDVIFVPTPNEVVDMMLKMAGTSKKDTVYDLGCGDGRIVITAAQKYGARGVGIDIDPERVKEANENVKKAGVADRVKIIRGDLFEADLSPATVVTLYLLTDLNLKLRPKLLKELKPGTPVVSHAFSMGDWKPERTAEVSHATVYLWRVPQRKA